MQNCIKAECQTTQKTELQSTSTQMAVTKKMQL